MTAMLVNRLSEAAYTAPSDKEEFFTKNEQLELRNKFELLREIRPIGQPNKSCDVNLFLGFFFDGTRNNYDTSTNNKDLSHSNVARLYGAFPGQHVPGVPFDPDAQWATNPENYQQFFKVYVPGVGTPFRQVNDDGQGITQQLGSAIARYAERRILWALAQALNCVFRYLTRSGNGPGLFSAEEVLGFCKTFDLGRSELLDARKGNTREQRDSRNRATLKAMLDKLHSSIKPHMIDPATGQCQKVDPGRVQRIYVSAFGFSRGAAEARVFTNWLLAMCEIDAQLRAQPGPTLASFPVTFDFLGLFDTVASVGLAASSLFADGHGGWADAEESLRVPASVPCLHIVAAHEFRRSFPLDSIHVGNALTGDKHLEWVCPGMHSDIGGGYTPREQGKGTEGSGSDMLSRIPLAVMYRAARLAGVPLKLELARPVIQQQFAIAKELIRDFNNYRSVCRTTEGTLREVMAEQRKHFILWRKSWAGRAKEMAFVNRASEEDRSDIIAADKAFATEIKDFESWRKKKKLLVPNGRGMPREVDNVPGIDSERLAEWQRIEQFWNEAPVTHALFEERVHDSHAWFKLTGHEASDFRKEMEKLVAIQTNAERAALGSDTLGRHVPSPLTARQQEWVALYRSTGQFAPEFTEGREWYAWGAGYLRYRRSYGGSDKTRLTLRQLPGTQEDTRETVDA